MSFLLLTADRSCNTTKATKCKRKLACHVPCSTAPRERMHKPQDAYAPCVNRK
jgi:hypothetical protein